MILQPCEQRFKIVTAALELDVVPLGDVVDAHVELVSAGKDAGDLFAEEEIGAGAQILHRVDGIVIGDGHQVHAEALEFLVNLERLVVAFAAYLSQERDGAHARVPGMDMHIALHMRLVTRARSHFGDRVKKHP